MNIFRYILRISIFAYLTMCLLLFIFQRDLLYNPSPIINHPYDRITFTVGEIKLDVIVLNKGKAKAILFFGGNSQAVVKSAEKQLADFPNHTIYLFNYRGFGRSSGQPEEQLIYKDALLVYDALKSRLKHQSVSVIGRSLGTGVATYVAANREVDKLILITPYDSIERIAQGQYPIFPISLLLKDTFDSLSRVTSIKAKTLIILAQNDTLVPYENSKRLIDAFPAEQLSVVTLAHTDHINVSHKKRYHEQMTRFIYGL